MENLTPETGGNETQPFRVRGRRYTPDWSGYREAFTLARGSMVRGDFYLVNLTGRCYFQWSGSLANLWKQWEANSRDQFLLGHFDGQRLVTGLSPERFIHVKGDRIRTEPIKGTRRRSESGQLRLDAKEKTEQLMVTDLLRNDLGRICRPDSVRVKDFQRLDDYANISHLVSTIHGRLSPELELPARARDPRAVERLRQILWKLLPAGSVSGVPKKISWEFIRRAEPDARGIYTGVAGVLDLTGPPRADSCILIRTLELDLATGTGRMGTGGGITMDSDPWREYQEWAWKTDSILGPPGEV